MDAQEVVMNLMTLISIQNVIQAMPEFVDGLNFGLSLKLNRISKKIDQERKDFTEAFKEAWNKEKGIEGDWSNLTEEQTKEADEEFRKRAEETDIDFTMKIKSFELENLTVKEGKTWNLVAVAGLFEDILE